MNHYLLLLFVIFLTCAGQLSQKQATHSWKENAKRQTLIWLGLSVIFLAGGMLLWLKLLQYLPLSQAYPFLSINLILVTLSGHFFFKEKVTLQHWLGIGIMMVGILLLGQGI
ncbi:4-amino-4-deoxy-L-arabinose-phospho-UDP flippase [Candidatus Williamhamiltonella defendens]|uniref:Probable 4-amino-4-deoxy-L-arabinose-phosphoundecaprenol flippase subunit ArnE n=2 Tax=Candidatus Williamhamiltonella defendens TaxID=138072 RepID=ARNE_HAMD5|nr:4-amino-4-deoxy-L-arabinose-phosphoundecaprenol flippase subunit ArnE [Candidatus Hamiltonella defensa]C4K4T7.1 RecName: Full=Probable 4-amino-4-deoxy-L-arabinose-phosphoundecaprenol flippase subunit ArnE; Short=L-Ara4N-phosphoundecaprenol flippase subunit ArnE; AltName: Full=Undecaprenyl phosphate-aminoarabinose flippase subunit ArnE [Candidatus Hamiltonella defensa 5AT (Acyrthosiphon pisum)]ACQ67580.1 subunit of ArnE/ArnF undecaprenyl-phosphate-alpha-L-Ara4N flippase [Candidatus Hamiltonella